MCDAGKESERWCLREPRKSEARTEQGRAMSEKGGGVRSKPNSRDESESPREGQDRLEQSQGITWSLEWIVIYEIFFLKNCVMFFLPLGISITRHNFAKF